MTPSVVTGSSSDGGVGAGADDGMALAVLGAENGAITGTLGSCTTGVSPRSFGDTRFLRATRRWAGATRAAGAVSFMLDGCLPKLHRRKFMPKSGDAWRCVRGCVALRRYQAPPPTRVPRRTMAEGGSQWEPCNPRVPCEPPGVRVPNPNPNPNLGLEPHPARVPSEPPHRRVP